MIDYSTHNKICIPDEDFGLTKDSEISKPIVTLNKNSGETKEKETIVKKEETDPKKEKNIAENKDINSDRKFDFLTGMSSIPARKSPDQPSFTCNLCTAGFESLKEYSQHKAQCTQPSVESDNKSEKKDLDEGMKDGKIMGVSSGKNNLEIPQTHSNITDKKENIVTSVKMPNSSQSSQNPEHSKENLRERKSVNVKNNASKPPKVPKDCNKSENGVEHENLEQVKPNDTPGNNGHTEESKNIQMESLKQSLPTPSKNSGLFCIMLFAILLITTLLASLKCIQRILM